MEAEVGARWVVTHHLATADHFDVRIEINAVLVSWAVPKGPSLDPAVRRMAIRTDDHGMEHLEREGVFGSHVVQMWDTGVYSDRSHAGGRVIPAAEGLERGRLSVWLEGSKLRGGFTLLRTDRGPREYWLMMKKSDEHAVRGSDVVGDEPRSVTTGRTIDQIRDDG